jgi:thioredoxin
MGDLATVDDATFDEFVASAEGPVVIDFWAEWCGPCKPLGDLLAEVAGEHDGPVRFAKVDIEDALRTAKRFDVQSLPTVLVLRDGEPVKRLVGGMGRTALREALAEYL